MIETDAVIVGAGPVGLFQAFELGLLEIGAHLIDALPYPGGQCIELYPDKPIYDIPALKVCTGRELVERLLAQIEPFAPSFHLGQQVSVVERQADGRYRIATDGGTQLLARTVFVAAGAGAFQPRKLQVEGIDRYLGTQVHYRVTDAAALVDGNLVVLGESDEALALAMAFSRQAAHPARSVTLIHRRDAFKAEPATVDRMRALCAAGAMRFLAGQVIGFDEAGGRLAAITVSGSDGIERRLPLDALLVCFGLSPKLGPIADWGLALERKQVVVDTEKFETNTPGIFAVGDVNTYPGKRKLILCGFHEATLAAFGAAAHVRADQRVQLEYTTTSTRLHRVLGVAPPAPGG